MVDPNTPASTKVRAADSILDHAAKAIEIEDIEVRVAALETATSHAVGLDPGSIDDYWRTSARWTPGMVLETPPTNRSGRFLAPVRLFSAVQTRSDPLTSKFLRNIVASL
jgi:hypothetical protein